MVFSLFLSSILIPCYNLLNDFKGEDLMGLNKAYEQRIKKRIEEDKRLKRLYDKKYTNGTTREEILKQLEYEIQDMFVNSMVVNEEYPLDALKPNDIAEFAVTLLEDYEENPLGFNVHPAVCVAFANGGDDYEDPNYDKFNFQLSEAIRRHLDEDDNE